MSRRGFTLVEMLVALTIASLIALIAHEGVGTLIALTERADRHRSTVINAAAVRRQLAEWVRAAEIGDADDFTFEGIDRMHRGRPDDALHFTTAAAGSFEAGRMHVALEIDRESATSRSELVAILSRPAARTDEEEYDGTTAPASGHPRRRMVLLPHADGIDIRYRLRMSDGARWFDGWVSAVRLPASVSIRVYGGDSIPSLFAVPVLVPLAGTQ